MREYTPVILGLSRQAKLWGLPMPYMMAVAALTVLPFIWIKWIPWILTGPVWYLLARLSTIANPHGHRVFIVVMSKTMPRFTFDKKKRFRRHV